MYIGLDAFRKYTQIYLPPYDNFDIDIIDCLLEGSVALNEDGSLIPTAFVECKGEA